MTCYFDLAGMRAAVAHHGFVFEGRHYTRGFCIPVLTVVEHG